MKLGRDHKFHPQHASGLLHVKQLHSFRQDHLKSVPLRHFPLPIPTAHVVDTLEQVCCRWQPDTGPLLHDEAGRTLCGNRLTPWLNIPMAPNVACDDIGSDMHHPSVHAQLRFISEEMFKGNGETNLVNQHVPTELHQKPSSM